MDRKSLDKCIPGGDFVLSYHSVAFIIQKTERGSRVLHANRNKEVLKPHPLARLSSPWLHPLPHPLREAADAH